MTLAEYEFDKEERDHFARIAECALRVNQRHHFFNWAQGPLQTLLPHEILICGIRRPIDGEYVFYHFRSTRYFDDRHFDLISKPDDGMLPMLVRAWEKSGEPILLDGPGAQALPKFVDPTWVSRLEEVELKNLAVQGVCWMGGPAEALVALSRLSIPFDYKLVYRMKMLAPCIAATLAQVLAEESGRKTMMRRPATASPINARQIEILEWVRDGKTNDEIGQILNVSPHTVKNHLQNILKRLCVRSRGQAVARAISLGAIAPHRH